VILDSITFAFQVPGDSGYPTYLGSRISAFYERAGPVTCLGKELGSGSVTLIGAYVALIRFD